MTPKSKRLPLKGDAAKKVSPFTDDQLREAGLAAKAVLPAGTAFVIVASKDMPNGQRAISSVSNVVKADVRSLVSEWLKSGETDA